MDCTGLENCGIAQDFAEMLKRFNVAAHPTITWPAALLATFLFAKVLANFSAHFAAYLTLAPSAIVPLMLYFFKKAVDDGGGEFDATAIISGQH
jgi:hypothetical protein